VLRVAKRFFPNKVRDAFKNAALAAAGIPLLRVVVTGRYDRAALRANIQEIMGAAAG
jgi:hypothetical protein